MFCVFGAVGFDDDQAILEIDEPAGLALDLKGDDPPDAEPGSSPY
jgi:hypothetical protein